MPKPFVKYRVTTTPSGQMWRVWLATTNQTYTFSLAYARAYAAQLVGQPVPSCWRPSARFLYNMAMAKAQ